MLRRTLVSAVAVVLGAVGAPVVAAEAGAHTGGEVSGFEFPESAYWDGETGSFYVTNFGGTTLDPTGREEDGYISRLSGEGQMKQAKWVTGLRSPKGMRRAGDLLYVADVGQLVVVDVAAAAITATVDLDAIGAVFPNDVAVDEASGDVYVSDMLRNAIYRLPAGTLTPEIWLESADLEAPNGLLVDGGQLMVAGFGRDLDPATRKPREPGRVLAVDLATRAIAPYAGMAPYAQLDGIERLGPDFIVTDNPGGRVVRLAPDGSTVDLATDMPGAADLALRPGDRTLAVPDLNSNVVTFMTVPA